MLIQLRGDVIFDLGRCDLNLVAIRLGNGFRLMRPEPSGEKVWKQIQVDAT